jgi:hypothetical protein
MTILPIIMLPIIAVATLLGMVLARPLATLIYRLQGKGKYLPY